jgi:hypothetical protein
MLGVKQDLPNLLADGCSTWLAKGLDRNALLF